MVQVRYTRRGENARTACTEHAPPPAPRPAFTDARDGRGKSGGRYGRPGPPCRLYLSGMFKAIRRGRCTILSNDFVLYLIQRCVTVERVMRAKDQHHDVPSPSRRSR